MSLSVNIKELDIQLHNECRRSIDIDKKVNRILKSAISIELVGGIEYKYLIDKIVSAVKREVNKFNKEDE